MNRVTTSPCGVPTAIHLPLPYLTGHGEGELEGRGGVADDERVGELHGCGDGGHVVRDEILW